MKILISLIIVALALQLTGCLKRQTAKRLIYTPPPPAPSKQVAQEAGVLVIAPPPAPAPSKTAPKQEESEAPALAPEPPPEHRTVPTQPADTVAEPPASPPAAAPQLEPALSAGKQVEQRGQIGGLRDRLQQRIRRLHQATLSPVDQKALQDAELFLSESGQALQSGDLQQSLNLAQKADLLVSAVEKKH